MPPSVVRAPREVADVSAASSCDAGAGAEKRRVGPLRDLAEAQVQHLVHQLPHVIAPIVFGRPLRQPRALVQHRDVAGLGLGVGGDVDKRLGVRGHLAVRLGRGGSRRRQRRKQLAHLRDDRRRVDVADDDDGHAVGTIPGLVEVLQARGGEAAQDLGRADRDAFGVPRLVVEDRRLLLEDAPRRALPQPPLFDHHAAFLVDLDRVERHAAGKVGERQQSLVDQALLVGRHLQHVDGLVKRGVGVDVRAEARAGGLEERDQLAGLEVLRAVERHVLEQVREPALVVVFEQRPGLHRQPHQHALFRAGVLAHVVAQAVGQRPDGHRRVGRQRAGEGDGRGGRRLRRQHGGRAEGQGQNGRNQASHAL